MRAETEVGMEEREEGGEEDELQHNERADATGSGNA